MQKFIAILFIIVVSICTGFVGFYITENLLEMPECGFVISFLLPTLIYYWNQQLDLNDAAISKDTTESEK